MGKHTIYTSLTTELQEDNNTREFVTGCYLNFFKHLSHMHRQLYRKKNFRVETRNYTLQTECSEEIRNAFQYNAFHL